MSDALYGADMGSSTEMLKKMMDVCALRQEVLANNIANANTQNYKRRDIEFKKAFAEAVKSGSPEDFASIIPKVSVDRTAKVGSNGNSVNMEKEMTRVTDNNLLYGVTARVLTGKFQRMQKAIKGR
ncbi:flagellar basal-body rod protein FlgB [bacterium E08(2017)]|nr:flagellar basal-body rod protein FlgB [bacterium E08(2017)]